MRRIHSRISAAALVLIMLLTATADCVAQSRTAEDIRAAADGLINWKKRDVGSSGYLFCDEFISNAGTTNVDWYAIALSRYGYEDNYAAYLAVLKANIEKKYKEKGRLSAAKATEWHRIAMAVLAAGGNPLSFGTDENGVGINLIADGVYNRGRTASLGKQGINGWIWGLIALDSKRYPVPSGADYTRDDIIVQILCRQLSDGGFALAGTQSDPDISAMAVMALSPYYNNETEYTYTLSENGNKVTKSVRTVVDEAVIALSEMQAEDGEYYSWGTKNAESTAQVIMALCALGINPSTDTRFVKNGSTLIDVLMKYQNSDGGFTHSLVYDTNNPSAQPGISNSMTGEQVLCALTAYYRLQKGMRGLYDFRAEQDAGVKNKINNLKQKIDSMGDNPSSDTVSALMSEYNAIAGSERSYVYNYFKLSNADKRIRGEAVIAAKSHNAAPNTGKTTERMDENTLYSAEEIGSEYQKNEKDTEGAESVEDSSDINEEREKVKLTVDDVNAVNALPSVLTTENYTQVLTLLDRVENAEESERRTKLLEILYKAKEEIEGIQAEIDSINEDVRDKLYPFESISWMDRKTIRDIMDRYNSLSDYDKGKIEYYDDIVRAMTQADNLYRAFIISIALFALAAVTAAAVTVRIVVRRKRKRYDMMMSDESRYEDI